MTYCVGLTDTAYAVAEGKLAGVSLGAQRAEYAGGPRAELLLPLIEKVYGDRFSSAWDYALRFFGECAQNIGGLAEDRLGSAKECLQQGMIASAAHSQKAAGVAKETVYARFAKFPAAPTRALIDAVYAGAQDRPQAELAAWNACMAPLTRAD